MRALVFLAISAWATNAVACYVPPREQHVSVDELIARTKNIVLAEVTRAELVARVGVIYTFKRVRVLAGQADDTFVLTGDPASWYSDSGTFGHHTDPVFWEGRGRMFNSTDCKIHLHFAVGGTYLLFLDKPYHVKSFELIMRTAGNSETKDKWLQYVEKALGPNN